MILGLGGVLLLAPDRYTGRVRGLFPVSTRGATFGKLVLGLKVIRADGSMLPRVRRRADIFAMCSMRLHFMIGFIMAGFDPEKRALHDRICDTRVIYAK